MRSFNQSMLVSAALLAVASGAHAQKAGDNILGIGIAQVVPSTSLGTLTTTGGGTYTGPIFTGAPAATVFNGATAGASSNIDSATTVTLGFLHMFTDNIGAELTLGVPPKLSVNFTTPNASAKSHPGAATATYLAPAVVAKYLFNKPGDQWRPYLGLGATYVSFADVTANNSDALIQGLAGSSASLSSGWAPVYNLGVIYNIDARWSINASVSYIPLKTTATFTGNSLSTSTATTTGNIDLNTTDYVIRVGYKF